MSKRTKAVEVKEAPVEEKTEIEQENASEPEEQDTNPTPAVPEEPKKEFPWKKAAIIGVGVLTFVGGVLAVGASILRGGSEDYEETDEEDTDDYEDEDESDDEESYEEATDDSSEG